MVLAAASVGIFRACMAFWGGSGGAVPLGELVGQAFHGLADGLPENSAFRGIQATVTGQHVTDRRDR
jgi:hypothetical protein